MELQKKRKRSNVEHALKVKAVTKADHKKRRTDEEQLTISSIIAASRGEIGLLSESFNVEWDLIEEQLQNDSMEVRCRCNRYIDIEDVDLSSAKIIHRLIACYAENNIPVRGNPLHAACLHGQAKCVSFLVGTAPYLMNMYDKHGIRPVEMAVIRGDFAITQLLLNSGSKMTKMALERSKFISIPDCFKWISEHSLLQSAAKFGQYEILELLLQRGDNPLMDCPVQKCRTKSCLLLPLVARNGHVVMLDALARIMPINGEFGCCAVGAAASSGHTLCLRYLLQNGAPTFHHYPDDAEREVWNDILCNYFDEIERTSKDSNTFEIVQLLIEHGMSLTTLAKMNIWCFCYVNDDRKSSILGLLLKVGLMELRHAGHFPALTKDTVKEVIQSDFISAIVYRERINPQFRDDLGNLLSYFPVSFSVDKIRYFIENLHTNARGVQDLERLFHETIAVPSLRHLCRWTIRSEIAVKNGSVLEVHVSKLELPPVLQRYLWFH